MHKDSAQRHFVSSAGMRCTVIEPNSLASPALPPRPVIFLLVKLDLCCSWHPRRREHNWFFSVYNLQLQIVEKRSSSAAFKQTKHFVMGCFWDVHHRFCCVLRQTKQYQMYQQTDDCSFKSVFFGNVGMLKSKFLFRHVVVNDESIGCFRKFQMK